MVDSARLTNVGETAFRKHRLPIRPPVGKPSQVKVKGGHWVEGETCHPEICIISLVGQKQ